MDPSGSVNIRFYRFSEHSEYRYLIKENSDLKKHFIE